MCYTLLLSTTSTEDLAKFSTGLLRFDATIPARLSADKLLYPNKWYVGSRTGCSCSFRHLAGPEFDFGVPQDWFPEEKLDIEATLQFIGVVRSLLLNGARLDCIDLWEGHDAEGIRWVSVNLGLILDEEFRFYENHHFDFME
jgi:hypothetical protein